jgi:hypothetical protein
LTDIYYNDVFVSKLVSHLIINVQYLLIIKIAYSNGLYAMAGRQFVFRFNSYDSHNTQFIHLQGYILDKISILLDNYGL